MNALVIIDSRKISNDVIENHTRHLNMNEWHLYIYTSSIHPISTPHFRRHYYGDSSLIYNKFLTRPSFWADFLNYEYVLIFQQDSLLLRSGIDEFIDLGYDYYGATWFEGAEWARKDRAGGNGGLSLRKPKPHLELCATNPYNPRYHGNEDVYFTHHLPNVAPVKVCSRFSCETIFQLGTLGCHAIEKHLTTDQSRRILDQYR